MNWLLFYLLLALHPIAYFLIVRMDYSWVKRALFLIAASAPAAFYCWDYFAIQYEHKKLCADEGGLSVFIQPENVDRVRIVGRNTGVIPREVLQSSYPKVKLVQALTENRDPKTGHLLDYYESYTASPNPRADQAIPSAIGGEVS